MPDPNAVRSLLHGIEFDDPRLFSLLDMITSDLYDVYFELHPPILPQTFSITGQLGVPGDVIGFIATVYSNNVRLSWNQVQSSGIAIASYQIKYRSGSAISSDWDIASALVRTDTLSADVNPVTIPLAYGTHSFLIKAVTPTGIESNTATIVQITIPTISAPTITSTVLGNFVLLNWTVPTSTFSISYYRIKKNGSLVGTVSGTFEVVFEIASGTFSYIVEAVDIVGNIGIPSPAAVVKLIAPPDFTRSGVLLSTLTGTRVNCVLDTPDNTKLLACVNTTETWETHFTSRAWNSPQDQINAGYLLFIQPALTTATYTEVFDFGTILNSVSVVLQWNLTQLNGTVSVTSTLEFSTDNISYTAPVSGPNAFASSVRYVRAVVSFSGNDTALCNFFNFTCSLDVQQVTDSGTITANAADSGGTLVTYNKSFSLAPAVTATAESVQPVKVIITSVTKTSFRVLVFDSTGARITLVVDWKARGVIT